MHYNALNHWSKFQINLTKFQWVTFKKPSRSSLKSALIPILGVLLARIKFYLQICTPTVIKTIPSWFLLNLSFFWIVISFLFSISFAEFCSTLKLILDPPLKILKAPLVKPINFPIEHCIDLKDDIPVSSPPRKIPYFLEKPIKSEIKILFENNQNENCQYVSLIVPIIKKNRKIK